MKQYMEEFSFEDPKIAEEFINIIKTIVQKEIKKLQFNKSYPAKVVAVGSGTADIQLLGGTEIITGVKVRDGLSLSVDDKVYIVAINGSLNNIFVDLKK